MQSKFMSGQGDKFKGDFKPETTVQKAVTPEQLMHGAKVPATKANAIKYGLLKP